MGYSCPVCGDPQADDIHLANHLAFTALIRGGDHEAWLDEHVPNWGQQDEDGLAEIVVDYADETEYEQVFEDTTGNHDHSHGAGQVPERANVPTGDLDAEAQAILDEAYEMTQKRRENE